MAEFVRENTEFEKNGVRKENVISSIVMAEAAIVQGTSESTIEPLLYVQPWPRPSLKNFSGLVDVYTRRFIANKTTNKVTASECQKLLEKKKPQFSRRGPSEICEIPEMSVIQKYMRCSLCSTIPSPDALMCTSGHLICFACATSLVCCPFELKEKTKTNHPHGSMLIARGTFGMRQCGENFTNARNQLYTHVYHNSVFKCKNTGCGQMNFGPKFYTHAAKCHYLKTVKCQHRNECGLRTVLMDLYPKHLQKAHTIDMIKCSIQSCLVEYTPKQEGMIIKKLFYVHKEYFGLIFEELDDSLYIWIAHMKNFIEIQKEFRAQVDVFSPIPLLEKQKHEPNTITKNQPTAVTSHFGKVCAFVERDVVLKEHHCVQLTLKVVRKILVKHLEKDHLVIKVFICPEEVSSNTFKWKPVVCEYETLYWRQEMAQALGEFQLTDFLKDETEMKKDEQNDQSRTYTQKEMTKAFNEFEKLFKSTWGTLFLQHGHGEKVKQKPLPIKPGLEQYKMEPTFCFETTLKKTKLKKVKRRTKSL